MPILINAYQLSKSFGARPLFHDLSFSIESGDRIGLIGPNGAGKSTLLRIIASEEPIDSGVLSFQKNLKVGFLKQVPEFKPNASLLSSVFEGIEDKNSSALDHPLEDWEKTLWAEKCLETTGLVESQGFSSTTLVETLSGGWKKRVALARELARKPDLLLLDEPTNHLDLESILWIEKLLASAPFAVLTITHDRAFLQKISNRIIELDRRNPNGLLNVKGNYLDYLEIKTQLMEDQKQREASLSNTLRREIEWLRQGAKARTTKQQARIQRAETLKDEVQQLQSRNLSRTARFEFQKTEKNPKKLVEAKSISKNFGDQVLFQDFDLIITPGSRIGILGKNGAGKSTLIKTLLGLEEPNSGSTFRSDHLQVAYFEQNREALDPNRTLLKTLCPSGDQVIFQGKSIHIRSYLDRFLFDPAQAEMPVGRLSGGEQSRILIAKLMLQEANLLVLDEPTNDLDLATLEVLEDCLNDFPGAVLLVTHDRFFLDRIATQILALPGTNELERSARKKILSFSSLDQWEAWSQKLTEEPRKQDISKDIKAEPVSRNSPSPTPVSRKKLSFKEQRELDSMEETILTAESELSHWTQESLKPENSANPKKLAEISEELAKAQKRVEDLYSRWSILSESKNS